MAPSTSTGASGGARTEYLQQFSPMRGNRYPAFSTMVPAAVNEEEKDKSRSRGERQKKKKKKGLTAWGNYGAFCSYPWHDFFFLLLVLASYCRSWFVYCGSSNKRLICPVVLARGAREVNPFLTDAHNEMFNEGPQCRWRPGDALVAHILVHRSLLMATFCIPAAAASTGGIDNRYSQLLDSPANWCQGRGT